jgi:dTDP-L-rhamnose 4-epimerase
VQPLPTDEDTPTRPERAYSISKFAQERLVLSAGLEFGIPAVALRYFLTYGPRQSLLNPYTGICSIFSTMILNGSAPIIFEDGRQTRDFVFVEDVARANLLVMKDSRADFQVFNVGSGHAISVGELCQRLAGEYGRTVQPRIEGEYRIGDVRHIAANIDKLKQLGFQPQVSIDAGIRRYADWIRSVGEVKEYFSVVEARLRDAGIIRSRTA